MAQPDREAPPEPRGDDLSKLLRTYDERKAKPEPTVDHGEVKRLLGL
jgi:hypothetical protein